MFWKQTFHLSMKFGGTQFHLQKENYVFPSLATVLLTDQSLLLHPVWLQQSGLGSEQCNALNVQFWNNRSSFVLKCCLYFLNHLIRGYCCCSLTPSFHFLWENCEGTVLFKDEYQPKRALWCETGICVLSVPAKVCLHKAVITVSSSKQFRSLLVCQAILKSCRTLSSKH